MHLGSKKKNIDCPELTLRLVLKTRESVLSSRILSEILETYGHMYQDGLTLIRRLRKFWEKCRQMAGKLLYEVIQE